MGIACEQLQVLKFKRMLPDIFFHQNCLCISLNDVSSIYVLRSYLLSECYLYIYIGLIIFRILFSFVTFSPRRSRNISPRASVSDIILTKVVARAIAQAVSRRLPTAVARVRAWVRSCGICGGQSGTGAGFLQVLQFPLPILIPPTAPHSSSIIRGWYNRPLVAAVPSGLSLTALTIIKKIITKFIHSLFFLNDVLLTINFMEHRD
jgi:hypothetical protein